MIIPWPCHAPTSQFQHVPAFAIQLSVVCAHHPAHVGVSRTQRDSCRVSSHTSCPQELGRLILASFNKVVVLLGCELTEAHFDRWEARAHQVDDQLLPSFILEERRHSWARARTPIRARHALVLFGDGTGADERCRSLLHTREAADNHKLLSPPPAVVLARESQVHKVVQLCELRCPFGGLPFSHHPPMMVLVHDRRRNRQEMERILLFENAIREIVQERDGFPFEGKLEREPPPSTCPSMTALCGIPICM
mmetsp:Transcript_33539/g.107838  ORF Transcript_33539/g.107838 Transcript_33539/m.107838 type:complete len:251 (+) Transcript_33539:217-969(+)